MAPDCFMEEMSIFKERIRFGIDRTQHDQILGKVPLAMIRKFNFVDMVNSGGGYQSQDGDFHDWYGSSYMGSEEY